MSRYIRMNYKTIRDPDKPDGYAKIEDGEVLNVFPLVRDVAVFLFVMLLLLMFWPLRTVPTGHRGVITVGGAIKGIENEGFLLIAPWQKLDVFNIRAEQTDITNAAGATADTQPVTVNLTVRYSISTDKVAEVFEKYSHNGDLTNYIFTASVETFKAVTARYTAPELISKRPQVSSDIRELLATKVAIYGAQVINIDMTNFAFEKAYMDAINAKVNQEQLRQAADNKLRTVESEQKQKVAVAEAEATALKATADGKAYANLAIATAEAKSLQLKGEGQAKAMEAQANALAKNPQLVEMKKAESWNGVLPVNVYAGAPIPFLNVGK